MRPFLVLLLMAAPAMAQDLVFSPGAVETCLSAQAEAGGRRGCIGASANACMEATPGGMSTVGMGGCLDRELGYWDARLNAAYGKAMAQAKVSDAGMKGLALSVPSEAAALRAMQRAWIPYRDARCDYERSQWGGGTGGGPAALGCLMVMTGEQALYLEDMLRGN